VSLQSSSQDRNTGKPSWRIRRRLIITTLLFCASSWGYAQLFQGVDMVQAVLPTIAVIATGVIGAYIGGAAYEDVRLPK
jgi:hypothetical protein